MGKRVVVCRLGGFLATYTNMPCVMHREELLCDAWKLFLGSGGGPGGGAPTDVQPWLTAGTRREPLRSRPDQTKKTLHQPIHRLAATGLSLCDLVRLRSFPAA